MLLLSAAAIAAYFLLSATPEEGLAADYSLQKGNSLILVLKNNFKGAVLFTSVEIESAGRLIKVGIPENYPLLQPSEKRTLEFTFMHGCVPGDAYSANVSAYYRIATSDSPKQSSNFTLSGTCS